ncbi:MAG: hypothetical protein HY762_09005, partial [Planctomycetes bacterium]|nr:hypothetical protein [Planctomycetota bacterium]
LEMLNEDTNEIKAFCQDGINENVASVEVIKNLLNQMLKNPPPSKDEIEEKGKEAIKRKLTADNAVLETCNRILGLMDKHINTFPTSRRAQADELKKKIEERLGPEKTGESTSLSEK